MQDTAEAFARALPRHLDEAELADAIQGRLGLVLGQTLFEGAPHLLAVAVALHVDEIQDHEAAAGPDAKLIGDLVDGLEVRLHGRLFEIPAALTDEAARVHVDGREGFGLVDDQIAAARQRHLSRQRSADLVLDAVGVEDGLVPAVELDVTRALGHEHLDESNEATVLLAIVDDDFLDLVREQISGHLEHEIELRVEHGRGFRAVVLPGYLFPQLHEVADVVLELLLRQPFGHGSYDETALRRLDRVDHLAEPRALTRRADALRHADVIDRRQIDDVPAGQRDVARDAGALGADRLFRDLDHDLVALTNDLGDRDGPRDAGVLATAVRALVAIVPSSSVVASALGVASRSGCRVRPWRRVQSGCRARPWRPAREEPAAAGAPEPQPAGRATFAPTPTPTAVLRPGAPGVRPSERPQPPLPSCRSRRPLRGGCQRCFLELGLPRQLLRVRRLRLRVRRLRLRRQPVFGTVGTSNTA